MEKQDTQQFESNQDNQDSKFFTVKSNNDNYDTLCNENDTKENDYLNVGNLNILSDELYENPLEFLDNWIVSTSIAFTNDDFSIESMRVTNLILLSDILLSPEDISNI